MTRTPLAPLPNLVHARHSGCRVLGGILAFGSVLILTACGTSSPQPNTTATSNTTTSSPMTTAAPQSTTPQTTTSTDTLPPLAGASLAPKERHAEDSALYVEEVRVGHHEGFDRIVFEISGADDSPAPGWLADYVTDPVQQASGTPISYQGTVALNIGISALAYPFEINRPDPPTGLIPNTQAGIITGITHTGIFEAQGQYVVGLEREVPYAINVIQNPTRIVVDLMTD